MLKKGKWEILCDKLHVFVQKAIKVIKSFWDELHFLCKRLKIAKFFSLKRSKSLWGRAAITAPGDTNPSNATAQIHTHTTLKQDAPSDTTHREQDRQCNSLFEFPRHHFYSAIY